MLFRASSSAARSSAAFTFAAARSDSLICACSSSANLSAAVLFSLARCSHFLASAFQSVSCAGASAGGVSAGASVAAFPATSAGVGVLVSDMVFPPVRVSNGPCGPIKKARRAAGRNLLVHLRDIGAYPGAVLIKQLLRLRIASSGSFTQLVHALRSHIRLHWHFLRVLIPRRSSTTVTVPVRRERHRETLIHIATTSQ